MGQQSTCVYTVACVLGPIIWHTANILPDDKFPGIIFKALFGYQENLYLVQAVSYVVFLVTLGSFYFRSLSGRVNASANNQPSARKSIGSRFN